MSDLINVLVIPHQPHRNVRVRSLEMAAYLAGRDRYRVHVLTWKQYPFPYLTPLDKPFAKLAEALMTARTPHRITEGQGIRWVEMPYLLAPYPLLQRFNRSQLGQFIRQEKIQAVISANAYHFSVPKRSHRQLAYLYDVVDDHLSPGSGPHWQRTRLFTLAECAKADRILTISHGLQALLAAEGHPDSCRIPNGVDCAAFQNVPQSAVRAVREKYGLQDRFVVGYIGNHGWWSGMRFLLQAYRKLRESVPHACLLVTGPGEELPAIQRETRHEPDIIFTGPVPPADIAAYFHAASIGVLPFDPNPFTHNALPLKVLEYGAVRKRVLATPLHELQTLALPHVSLLAADAESWAAALAREAAEPAAWQPDWDETIRAYDWQTVLQGMEALLIEALEARPHAAAV